MTKSYANLLEEAQNFIEYLSIKNIDAQLDMESFRDYHVKIRDIFGKTITLYHKPSKGTFSIGTQGIKDNLIITNINKLWFEFNFPDEQNSDSLSAYVDGSFMNNKAGWGIVIVKNREIVHSDSGLVSLSFDDSSHQISGEIRAVLEALKYSKSQNYGEITIYYDYLGLEKWACGIWKAKSKIARYYILKLKENKIRIHWKKIEAHTGHYFNNVADQLARNATLLK